MRCGANGVIPTVNQNARSMPLEIHASVSTLTSAETDCLVNESMAATMGAPLPVINASAAQTRTARQAPIIVSSQDQAGAVDRSMVRARIAERKPAGGSSSGSAAIARSKSSYGSCIMALPHHSPVVFVTAPWHEKDAFLPFLWASSEPRRFPHTACLGYGKA